MCVVTHRYNRNAAAGAHRPALTEVREAAATRASQRLLVAQLRAGQHSLAPDRFWDTVRTLRERGAVG